MARRCPGSRDYLNSSTTLRNTDNTTQDSNSDSRQQQRRDLFSKAASMFLVWNCFILLSTSSTFSRLCRGVSLKPTRFHTATDIVNVCVPHQLSFTTDVPSFTHSSGAVWESRWPSWAVRPNEPSGFCGRKATLNDASAALVSACS